MPGRYRIFLGMAAGVGKTYRMLAEAQAEAEAGRDVVDRPARDARARGDRARRRTGSSRSRAGACATAACSSRRWTCPRILARAPELCLIDELAHTNAPGLEHPKRYEDIADVLAAGIDVFSTVNVQHLESLNDQVAELTGVRVRETVPDEELAARGRDRARRPPAGGPDRPPARRQGLPAARVPRRAQRLLPRSRTCARCARSRCARWPRTSRHRPCARRAADRRAPARASSTSTSATSASSAARGAPPSGSAASSTCSSSPSRSRPRASASGWRRCAG